MLLTIDIGNSSSKFGLFDKDELVEKFPINTDRSLSADNLFSLVGSKLPDSLEHIVISSVVKEVNKSYHEFGDRYFGKPPLFINHTFDFGFSIKYFPPEDCGADRLVDAFAAVEKFGAPCIVCDFGTATTIDFVSESKEYLGGIITPGPYTLGSALFDKTSKLPNVKFEKPENVIGNSTVSSIQSGIYFGYVGLVDGIIKRMISETNTQPKIVSTGGFAQIISEDSKFIKIVEPNLMLDGLRLAHKNWESKKWF